MNAKVLILSLGIATSSLASTETKEFDAASISEVDVQNMAGKVVIHSTESAKATVVAEKRVFSEKCVMTVEKGGNKLTVRVENSGFFSGKSCDVDFDISVPKSVKLNISTGSGDIKVSEIKGQFAFKVGSGDILADGDFSQINGKSGSGNISVKGLSGGGDLKTGSGDIQLTFGKAKLNGKLDISTGSGNALLSFPKGAQIKSSFKSGSGDFTNELGDTASADFKVSMKTGSGDLTIKAY